MMPVMLKRHITRKFVREHPNWLFVFGDNLIRKGRGGQAKEMRGEPNAVGIPTKRAPSRQSHAYFQEKDFFGYRNAILPDLIKLARHLKKGGIVVFPSRPLGAGLADLKRRAPSIYLLLIDIRDELIDKFGDTKEVL